MESKRAKVKLNQWVRLHDHNIAQKVMVIVEHFKDNVMGCPENSADSKACREVSLMLKYEGANWGVTAGTDRLNGGLLHLQA